MEDAWTEVVGYVAQNLAGLGPAEAGGRHLGGSPLLTAVRQLLVDRDWLLLGDALPGAWPPNGTRALGELMPMKKMRNRKGKESGRRQSRETQRLWLRISGSGHVETGAWQQGFNGQGPYRG